MSNEYESPLLVDMNEMEVSGSTRGVPVVVFVLVAGVTVVGAAFIVGAGIGWTVAVGTNKVVGKSK